MLRDKVSSRLMKLYLYIAHLGDKWFIIMIRGRRGRYRMVVGFRTTCAISAYHH